MMRFLIIILFFITLSLTGCAAKVVADSKPRVFGASTSGVIIQYTDNSGKVVTNKEDDEDYDGCDSACYFYHM